MPAAGDPAEMESILAIALGVAGESEDLDEILAGLATLLMGRYPVSRISLRTYDPGSDEIVIVAAWASGPTEIGAGTRLPSRSTSYHEVLRRGGAILSRWVDQDGTPLLDRMIHDEGNRSWVVVPLWRGDGLDGLLTVSAGTRDAFDESDLPFFEALGAALGGRLLALASR